MDYEQYVNQFNEVEQREIVRVIGVLKEQKKNNKLGGVELRWLFDCWHKLFPKQKQSMSCQGCRNAVYKFFSQLTDHLNNKMHEIG